MIALMDYYLWQEVFDPEMKYECQNCGALFGDAFVAWNGEAQGHVATCPACGAEFVVDDGGG
jgi:DNA-directed RNA polymerase subunit RPC12/RpoP